MDRKKFIQLSGFAATTICMPGLLKATTSRSNDLFFDISLAQWSLHRTLFDGKIDNLDFPVTAKKEFGITAVEYVNRFFADKAEDKDYLDEMNRHCDDHGVDQVLIMVDGEGALAITDDKKRFQAVENHYKWVRAAKYLGCHSIRVNARTSSNASKEDARLAAVEGLGKLAEFGADHGINIIVENHGGYSSDGQWLSEVISQVDMENCGTLPDFGNFCIEGSPNPTSDTGCKEEYNRYKGVKELMPFAKGVSAKSYAFDENGLETIIDFKRMLEIVHEAGYSGYVGIEYEGDEFSEYDGIRATKELLLQAGANTG